MPLTVPQPPRVRRLRTHAGRTPLADSLARLGSLGGRAELVFGPAGSHPWPRCADLLTGPDGFNRWRKRLADWLAEEYGQAPDRTAAGYLMAWYLRMPAWLAAVLFLHERRVPSLRPEHLAFRLAGARPYPDTVALLAPAFVCLPDDPDADSPDATVVRDERALAAVLRGRFTAHAARFVEVFGPTVRFGQRTLWAAATDALDNSFWQAGLIAGDEAAGVHDAHLVLPTRVAPFTSASTLRPLPDGAQGTDGQSWTRRRESCCFHYLLPTGGTNSTDSTGCAVGTGGGKGECVTCPRRLPKG